MHCNKSILSFILTTVYQLSGRTEYAEVPCGTVCCSFIHRTEFRNNQGEFLIKCFESCTARNHEHLLFRYAFPIT